MPKPKQKVKGRGADFTIGSENPTKAEPLPYKMTAEESVERMLRDRRKGWMR